MMRNLAVSLQGRGKRRGESGDRKRVGQGEETSLDRRIRPTGSGKDMVYEEGEWKHRSYEFMDSIGRCKLFRGGWIVLGLVSWSFTRKYM